MQENSEDSTDKPETKTVALKTKRGFSNRLRLVTAVVALLLVPLSYAGYIYASSPEVIRKPLMEHYHFRMQILVNGKAEDFSKQAYQVGYSKDQCNADLPKQPVHFHDNKDQLTHIHWEGITGGMVMKYYGWNYIGGINDALGYKLDKLTKPEKVRIHGDYLPAVPQDTSFYIYTGDVNSYKEHSFNDWKNQDLEEFFGTTSNSPVHEINKQKRSLLNSTFPKAYAHSEEVHSENTGVEKTQEDLKRINNLIGNVVIFVQKDKPTDQQIKDRFNKLVPLTESTCAG